MSVILQKNSCIIKLYPDGSVDKTISGFLGDASLDNWILAPMQCSTTGCTYAIRDKYYQEYDLYGCDNEAEFTSLVKNIYGRRIPKGKFKRPFSFARMAKAFDKGDLVSDSKFLRFSPYTADVFSSGSITFKKEGLFPVFFMGKPAQLFVTKDKENWHVELKKIRSTSTAEFEFYEKSFGLFVLDCSGNRCPFYASEPLPAIKADGCAFVKMNDADRVRSLCKFVNVADGDNEPTGYFVVQDTGRCKVITKRKIGGAQTDWIEVTKNVDGEYKIFVEEKW